MFAKQFFVVFRPHTNLILNTQSYHRIIYVYIFSAYLNIRYDKLSCVNRIDYGKIIKSFRNNSIDIQNMTKSVNQSF